MNTFYRLTLTAALASLTLLGCSEERKKEAARLAAEMEARERGETLAVRADTADASGVSAEQLSQSADSIRVADTSAADTQIARETASQPPQQPETITADSSQLRPAPNRPSSAMPPAIKDGFTVQVESSPLRNYIESQVELYKQRGYDAYLGAVTRPDDQKTYYRLRIGQYATMQEAAAVSQQLNETYGLQSWVDKATFGPATPGGEQPH